MKEGNWREEEKNSGKKLEELWLTICDWNGWLLVCLIWSMLECDRCSMLNFLMLDSLCSAKLVAAAFFYSQKNQAWPFNTLFSMIKRQRLRLILLREEKLRKKRMPKQKKKKKTRSRIQSVAFSTSSSYPPLLIVKRKAASTVSPLFSFYPLPSTTLPNEGKTICTTGISYFPNHINVKSKNKYEVEKTFNSRSYYSKLQYYVK